MSSSIPEIHHLLQRLEGPLPPVHRFLQVPDDKLQLLRWSEPTFHKVPAWTCQQADVVEVRLYGEGREKHRNHAIEEPPFFLALGRLAVDVGTVEEVGEGIHSAVGPESNPSSHLALAFPRYRVHLPNRLPSLVQ